MFYYNLNVNLKAWFNRHKPVLTVTVWGARDCSADHCASHFQTRHFTTLRRGNEPALSTLLPRGLFLLKSWEPQRNLGNTTAKWRTLLIRKHVRGFLFYRLCLGKLVDGSYLHFQITTPMKITSDTASRSAAFR